jgi:chloride channel 3/4/5
VAVAFGAPIGGVLFSLEEVSYYFPPKVGGQFFPLTDIKANADRALLMLLPASRLGSHHDAWF